MSLMNIFDVSGSAMSAQSLRLNTTASNMANADSAGGSPEETYRARHPVFSAVQQDAMNRIGFGNESGPGVQVRGIVESEGALESRHEPEHPLANEEGYVFYPNVDVVEEMSNMISASRSFQMNVEVMNSARTMMQRVMTLGQQ